jgi:two-component system response regulator
MAAGLTDSKTDLGYYCLNSNQISQSQSEKVKRDLILLVEDDPDDELMTLRSFRKSQIAGDVIVVRDGAAALDYLFGTGAHASRDLRVMPTQIILDLSLPKLNGLEVLQRIKSDERTRSIPVTMLTGTDYEVVTSQTLLHGAQACLMKPVTSDGLRQITSSAPSA